MIKKALIISTFLIICLISTICQAFTPLRDEQIALGGITLKTTSNDLYKIYGAPTKIDSDVITYGNSVFFQVTINNKKEIFVIATTANNGFATPDGITVGMKENVIYDIYGSPYLTEKYKDSTWGRLGTIKENGYDKMYRYPNKMHTKFINFFIKSGKVVAITCMSLDNY